MDFFNKENQDYKDLEDRTEIDITLNELGWTSSATLFINWDMWK